MPLTLEWSDVAIRLVLTVVAGALLGFDRSNRGRAAGIRTVTLVCLAASVAMIQSNQLLNTTGKATNSFVVLDLMRFPLGILTGMGFIGAGAILRRRNMVQGVTTAATLWTATAIGLWFGGQLVVGAAALAISMFVLCGFKRFELLIRQDRRATLIIQADDRGPNEEEVRAIILKSGCSIVTWAVSFEENGDAHRCTIRSDLLWRGRPTDIEPPNLIGQFVNRPRVIAVRWKGQR